MPHVLDPETGLCQICKKGEIAAIKEGRKFKRDHYDIRKAAVERVTHTKDPNYHAITDRHYVTYDGSPSPRRSQNVSRPSNASFRTYSKSPFARQSVDNQDFDSEDEEIQRIEANSRRSKLSLKPRNSLRKASIIHLQNSEPNIVYATSKAEKSPRYVVVNDDSYEAPVYVDYGGGYDYTNVINMPRKKKVVVHHHYDGPNGPYTVVEEENSGYDYQTGPANDVVYYKYK